MRTWRRVSGWCGWSSRARGRCGCIRRKALSSDCLPVATAPHADVLALIGAARTRMTPAPRAVVLDFGYSSVKRGIAHFSQSGALQHLQVLDGLALAAIGLGKARTSHEVLRSVVDVIAATVDEAQDNHGAVDGEVAVSLATYLTDRQPFPSSELYDLLTDVDFSTLEAELARATGRPLHVRYIHDGTAAAAALNTSGRDGIIVLGTSLGAGFTLPDQPRLAIAADLLITHN